MNGIQLAIILVVIWNITGNYVYQALNDKNWHTAFERSWFQAFTGLCCFLATFFFD